MQDFWATSVCPEKQSCPENFHCMEYAFHVQNFWATCACPEKQSMPRNFSLYWICIFIIQDFWSTCAYPEKQRVPWIHYIECVFYYSGFLRNLRMPWKQSLPWNFSSPGGRPPSPRLVRLWAFARVFNKKIGLRQNTFFPNLLSFSGVCLGSIAGLNFACLFGLNLIALTVACYITAFHTFFMWPLERTLLNNQRQ